MKPTNTVYHGQSRDNTGLNHPRLHARVYILNHNVHISPAPSPVSQTLPKPKPQAARLVECSIQQIHLANVSPLRRVLFLVVEALILPPD
jgi:hypothetical protein